MPLSSTSFRSVQVPVRPMNRAARLKHLSDPRWWRRLVISLLVPLVAMVAFASFFRIGVNGHACLDETFFLVGRWQPSFERGRYYTFESRGADPFPDGTVMVKQMVGIPGDRVQIGDGIARVNGKVIGDLRFGEKASAMRWNVDEIIPEGRYFMAGTTDVSYDSRYWGYVDAEQFRGRAWPLL